MHLTTRRLLLIDPMHILEYLTKYVSYKIDDILISLKHLKTQQFTHEPNFNKQIKNYYRVLICILYKYKLYYNDALDHSNC